MLVLLSGVSGAGKDTIKKELIKRMDNVISMPSYTDRKPREGEIDGKIYNFITTEEFETKIKEINPRHIGMLSDYRGKWNREFIKFV